MNKILLTSILGIFLITLVNARPLDMCYVHGNLDEIAIFNSTNSITSSSNIYVDDWRYPRVIYFDLYQVWGAAVDAHGNDLANVNLDSPTLHRLRPENLVYDENSQYQIGSLARNISDDCLYYLGRTKWTKITC